ncbi:MAG: transglycosylase domain-containing protein [Bacteroidales bacterium]|nr:transglycosylase domain-containing protein [Bacteroidales bacterium]
MKEKTSKILLKCLWLITIGPVVALAAALLIVGLTAEIPSFEELENPKSFSATKVLSDQGEVIASFHIENRMYVSYEQLSPYLVKAAVSTEDARFYKHCGIDFYALGRVAFKSLLLGDRGSGGGSTITQQLAKTLYPRDDTPDGFISHKIAMVKIKLKEWITAVKLERNYTKDELVAMYLNAVFFGSNAYGVKAAANTFFAKEPSELNIQESATLVGMINKPTRYNPAINYDLSIGRRNSVIRHMAKEGYISNKLRDSVINEPIELRYSVQDHNADKAPYFRDMLRRYMSASMPKRSSYSFTEDYENDMRLWDEDPLYGWLNKNQKPDGSPYSLDKDGLVIYSTVNAKMQKYAEEAISEHLGTYLQKEFFKDMKNKKYKPFAKEATPELVNTLMSQARRWSDRYRSLKKSGMSDKEIEKTFNTPTEMRVFAWNVKGFIDTTMTPNDSIKYYKSFLRSAFVAMEPGTGHVKAYIGGPNYRYFKYDNARQGKRQVGSTIKPFLYTLAMQEGFSPCDKVLNLPVTFVLENDTWTPASTDKAEFIGKEVTLKWGLTKSSNNISAYLMHQFGPKAMLEMCRKMGIYTYLPEVPSLCLGPADIALYDMVSAYNTFPSRGIHIEPIFVTKIEDKAGNVIATFSPQKHEAISESAAYLMVNLMQGVVNEGTGARLRSRYRLEGQIAGKTGTTNDQSDGWFIGYTPKLTAGIWTGAEDRTVHFESIALGGGSNMSLPIWGLFMQKVMADGTLGISNNDIFTPASGIKLNLNCDGSDDDLQTYYHQSQDEEDFFD